MNESQSKEKNKLFDLFSKFSQPNYSLSLTEFRELITQLKIKDTMSIVEAESLFYTQSKLDKLSFESFFKVILKICRNFLKYDLTSFIREFVDPLVYSFSGKESKYNLNFEKAISSYFRVLENDEEKETFKQVLNLHIQLLSRVFMSIRVEAKNKVNESCFQIKEESAYKSIILDLLANIKVIPNSVTKREFELIFREILTNRREDCITVFSNNTKQDNSKKLANESNTQAITSNNESTFNLEISIPKLVKRGKTNYCLEFLSDNKSLDFCNPEFKSFNPRRASSGKVPTCFLNLSEFVSLLSITILYSRLTSLKCDDDFKPLSYFLHERLNEFYIEKEISQIFTTQQSLLVELYSNSKRHTISLFDNRYRLLILSDMNESSKEMTQKEKLRLSIISNSDTYKSILIESSRIANKTEIPDLKKSLKTLTALAFNKNYRAIFLKLFIYYSSKESNLPFFYMSLQNINQFFYDLNFEKPGIDNTTINSLFTRHQLKSSTPKNVIGFNQLIDTCIELSENILQIDFNLFFSSYVRKLYSAFDNTQTINGLISNDANCENGSKHSTQEGIRVSINSQHDLKELMAKLNSPLKELLKALRGKMGSEIEYQTYLKLLLLTGSIPEILSKNDAAILFSEFVPGFDEMVINTTTSLFNINSESLLYILYLISLRWGESLQLKEGYIIFKEFLLFSFSSKQFIAFTISKNLINLSKQFTKLLM